MKHVHFIGIGGTGLSAIARVLLEKGVQVSGSDRTASPLFEDIQRAGAKTFLGHAPENINGADLVIRSSAIPDDNPEVLAAQTQEIPVFKRADFLQELTAGYTTLAVAGSHGKTTTTAMLVWLLNQMEVDPSYIVGGVVNQLGRNAAAGQGKHFVIEADEYDHMFLGLAPDVAVITNIEHDHPDCFPTMTDYRAAFKAFLVRVKPSGAALICIDDPEAKALMDEAAAQKILGYGTGETADYRASEIETENGLPVFTLTRRTADGKRRSLGKVRLGVPGRHNVLNATAALGVISELGLSCDQAIRAIRGFTGAGRRFEVIGEPDGTVIIDDYGHHPTEIEATLKAARSRYPDHRIWAVWQPHTFSRTRALETDFIEALSLADRAVILRIYAAREEDHGYTAAVIADALKAGTYCPSFQDATRLLVKELTRGDVLIVFSAGDATEISQDVVRILSDRKHKGQVHQE
jgi:UDP-N-acetylmuramate--alanine ligase